jgi:hypothetical protein
VEQAKAVVVLGGDDQVLHAGLVGEVGPLVGVELDGIEVVGELSRIPRSGSWRRA